MTYQVTHIKKETNEPYILGVYASKVEAENKAKDIKRQRPDLDPIVEKSSKCYQIVMIDEEGVKRSMNDALSFLLGLPYFDKEDAHNIANWLASTRPSLKYLVEEVSDTEP